MMNKVIFATGNQDKMKEIKEILVDLSIEVVSMEEAGIHVEIVEDGITFEENAVIKGKAVAACTNDIVLADDSGLEIDFLNKEPGVYSARYAGEATPYSIKNQMLLERLKGVPMEQRTARFVCVIVGVLPGGEVICKRGTMEGYIGYETSGENGFGYDPIFYVPEYECMSAQLDTVLKNKISHRGKALCAMKEELKEYFKGKEVRI